MDRETLDTHARRCGCDVFGVADVKRFDELPADKHPRAIFPECRSVVVTGRRVPRGALRGVEEGTNFTDYRYYGDVWLDNQFTSLTTFRVAEFIEDNGFEAVPIPNLPPEVPPLGVRVADDRPAPNVMLDLDDAAVRAGVGEIGYCGLLLTPRFGPRQRVQMLLTSAVLEPDAILDKPVCPRDNSCGQVCPLGAFVGEQERVICGKRMKVADIKRSTCAGCRNGAKPNRWHAAGKPDRLAAVCTRSCVDALEKAGRIANTFAAPFRRRQPWVVRAETDLYKM